MSYTPPSAGTQKGRVRVVEPITRAGRKQNQLLVMSGFHYLDDQRDHGFINWGTLLGLVITIGIGASFWTGVGLLIARFWR